MGFNLNFLKQGPKLPILAHLTVWMVFLTIINFWWLKSPILGVFLLIFWLIGLMSGILGVKILPDANLISQKSIGLITALGLIILIGSIEFYFLSLSNLMIMANFIILTGLALIIGMKNKIKPSWQSILPKLNLKGKLWLSVYLFLWLAAIVVLFFSQTNESILSPWQKVPKLFFVVYFLAGLNLIKIIFNQRDQKLNRGEIKLNLILISLYYFLSLCVVLIVYKIGYGFDPFVHRAAENKLAELGYILPKPLYYVGQYSLIVFLSKLFTVPLVLIDKIIVPALASMVLPGTFYYLLKDTIKNISLWLVVILIELVLLMGLFFYSLPQNLANLFLLILIACSFNQQEVNKNFIYWPWLLLLVIFLIHPLSGAAGLIYLAINLSWKRDFRFLNVIKYILISCLAPLFFVVGAWLGKVKIELTTQNLSHLAQLFKHSFSYLPFYSVYHLIYLLKYNWIILYGLIFSVGIYFMWQKKLFKLVKKQLMVAIILIINLILLSLIRFGAVIDYEQGEFIKRWGQIIVLVVLPVALYGTYFIIYKISQLNKFKWLIGLLTAGLLTIGLYLSYPHHDAFVKARGYSVSQYDIQAVKWIAAQNNDNYIVLANQSVSAAAVQEFGFKKYYISQNGQQVFYYPIPTSSPLYEIYLKMVYQGPKMEYIKQARQLVETKKVYLVINDYWLDFKQIINQAREIADDEINFNDRVWVFVFDKK